MYHKISLGQNASLICLYGMRHSAPSDPLGHVYLEQHLVFVLLHKLPEWPRSAQTVSSIKAGVIISLFTAASNFKRPVTANETLGEKTFIFMWLLLIPAIGSESLQTQTK